VLLVVPPFHETAHPALGVSQLKANLEANGFRAEVLYLNLRFAERVGLGLYKKISSEPVQIYSLVGEMIFSHVLFDRSPEDLDRYVEEVLAPAESKGQKRYIPFGFAHGKDKVALRDALHRLARHAAEFCRDYAVREVLDRDPWMVGFTSSFQQNCSSLAMLQEIKKRRAEVLTIMGGANCEREMGEELFASFPCLDFVGRGECDHSFVELVRAVRAGEAGTGIQGILARGQAPTEDSRRLTSQDLDALPYPDFTDYFSQLSASTFRDHVRPGLVMETSRGCWWGAKHQCTFCGLNGSELTFRCKSPERAMAEMSALVERYGVPRIEVVDNILDMKYFKTLLPRLADRPVADLFYETKANLTRGQVRLLARSGVRYIQPGIEGLSDQTLKLMRKGVTAIQNIQLLKWCSEEGIWVLWGYLFGLPYEDEGELLRLSGDFDALYHLKPPVGVLFLTVDRFSPYFNSPQDWGLSPIYPISPYYHVYPLPEASVRRIAYIFGSDVLSRKGDGDTVEALWARMTDWRQAFPHAHLLAVPRKKRLILLDTRPRAKRFLRTLGGLHRQLYEYCDCARGESDIVRSFADRATPDHVRSILGAFVEDTLMVERNGRYLSLATRFGPGYRKYAKLFPGGTASVPSPRGGRFRGRLWRALTLRIPPPAVMGAVLRRLRRLRASAKTRLAFRLAHVLAERDGAL